MRSEAIQAMLPYLDQSYANPSGSHRFARAARRAIDESRDDVADVLGCRPGDIVFTSGGTESDNTAILGAVAGGGGAAVCSAAEHHAVLHAVQRSGGVVVGVDRHGAIELDELAHALGVASHVSVVSVMAVNNEVGTIADVPAVASVVRRLAPGALLHTDAVQAATWLDLREVMPHVDLMSLSAHKFGGPKGVGILVERGRPTIEPLIIGGGQERERRSGTQNTAGIVAQAVALRATDAERGREVARIGALRDRLVDALRCAIDRVVETVPRSRKVAGSAHVCIDGIESESLLYLLDEASVCASAASSCASGAMEPSHVLTAMGVDRSRARGALRLTLGRTTTEADVDRAVTVIAAAVDRLRRRDRR